MRRAMPKRINTRAINTAAVPNPRAIIPGSGDFTNVNAVNGRDVIGPTSGFRLRNVVAPAVRSTGDVSPIPRAVPRITAVVSPDRAVGSVTCQTVRQVEAPSAREASFRFPGTRRSTTSAARMMMGSIMIVIASDAARPDRLNPKNTMTVA